MLYVLSLGGSIFFPEQVDAQFIKNFREIILNRVEEGDRFIIITGGGRLARLYQAALSDVREVTDVERDWVGIYATQANGKFMQMVFGEHACETFVLNPEDKVEFDKPVLIGAGFEPGWSTDMDAVLIAKTYDAKTVVNISNIPKIYTKDPNKFDDAEPIDKMTWSELRKIVGDDWKPGMNTPFDPTAAKNAQELGLKVVSLGGQNLENIKNFFEGGDIDGTIIEGK